MGQGSCLVTVDEPGVGNVEGGLTIWHRVVAVGGRDDGEADRVLVKRDGPVVMERSELASRGCRFVILDREAAVWDREAGVRDREAVV